MGKNERNPPWRTTQSIENFLNRVGAKNNSHFDQSMSESANDDVDTECIEYKEIKNAASNNENRMSWRKWETDYIVECYQMYRGKKNITQQTKVIEIACKLSKYT